MQDATADDRTARSDTKPPRRTAIDDMDITERRRIRAGSFNRGQGNFFVVDRNSRNVIWSVYERPKNSTPGELSKTAGRVVKRLQDDLTRENN